MDNATRLYRIRKTCLEMLADRDYVVTSVRAFLLVIMHAVCLLTSPKTSFVEPPHLS